MRPAPSVLGREEERDRARERLRSGGGVLFCGPGGIGKSTLMESLAAEAAEAGELVLRTCPNAAEAGLPYLALIDLFGAVLPEISAGLPDHLRTALESALLHAAPPPGTATDQLAIRVAVVEMLRGLAAVRPVLLVLDDAHWIDPPSAEVLAFAARRLAGTRVRVLAAERMDEHGTPRHAQLSPTPVAEIMLSALPAPLLKELVHRRMPETPTGSTLDRICAASGGNPLYALELARTLAHAGPADRPDDPLPVPERLRHLLADRLSALPPVAGPVLLLVAASARPGRELLPENDPGLTAALHAGILLAEADGSLRFSHPLLAELVYGDAAPRARRAAHTRLATLVDDPVERSRHRALATTRPDAGLADELVAAAGLARSRGAPAIAAALCRLAAARTPDPTLAARRLLEAAEHAWAAGLHEQARATCAAVLRRSDPAARVGARMLLVDLSSGPLSSIHSLLDAAADDAQGDVLLMARAHCMRADVTFRAIGVVGAMDEVREAERLARLAGDDDVLIEVLAQRVQIEIQDDTGGELPALAEALELAERRPLSGASAWIRQGHAVVQMRRGETAAAVETVRRLVADVERAGRTRDLARVLYTASSAYNRAGRCRDSAEAGRLCALLWNEVGLPPTGSLAMRGSAELNAGTVEAAVETLEAAVAMGESSKDPEWEAYSLIFLGRAELLRRNSAAAARHLGRGREMLHELGYFDPTMILLHADLAEALAMEGDVEAAREVINEAHSAVQRQHRHVILLGLDRVSALIDGFVDDPRLAADRLREAMSVEHAYPLELARCALTLATLERRARRRAAARSALAEAIRRYADAGCTPYLRHAQEELTRLDAADSGVSDLDRRLVELVRDGATNRAIAGALHLSVKAVEANLTRLYRRFGVTSRAELARATSTLDA
ncbi:DNA-binding NarL/FixJ family response regulator [Allocatelliglobosispora scoriae]|uniref:DNA-binding NarL/FixJ family response regulator n=1 Tax=Allocatelliglobosispora scoriae TaxID=643052 RepID=A0A841BSR6_9ACTN|nr:LuxR family transcriptional regulator [Allocatelliglobosispora scoriae]MBB5869963.1 DNA-binding NarL/FixJ family response regulator [Allocatelliglobosispora scoriae]